MPRFIAQAEKEILAQYQAEDLCDLFQRAYGDLHAITSLMERCSSAEEVSDGTIQIFGKSLRSALHILNKACSLFADFSPADFSPAEQPATA